MILPESNINLGAPVQYTDEPSKTWYINQTTGRIQGYCDGLAAVTQAVEIILSTERYLWQIYSPSSGIDYANLIGKDPAYVAVELQRRIRDALLMDTRVLGIEDFNWAAVGDRMTVEFTVITVFGEVAESLEV